MPLSVFRIAPAVLFLSACGQGARIDAEKPSTPAPIASSEVSTPRGTLPPFNSPTRYVGVWAAAETACERAAWRFERNRLQGPDWTACEFNSVTASQGGFNIDAQCTDGANERDARLRLSFAESAQAMLMQGVPETGDIGLIYCGPLGAS